MRRKVLQDFANTLSQRFVDLPSGFDLATFAQLGSGCYSLDLFTGVCTRDGESIAELKTCADGRGWLEAQLASHRVPSGLAGACMRVEVTVSDVGVKRSYGHVKAWATFALSCTTELSTDEKQYIGHEARTRAWCFDLYYQKLYGDPSGLVGPVSS
jgi:hypothetical protein